MEQRVLEINKFILVDLKTHKQCHACLKYKPRNGFCFDKCSDCQDLSEDELEFKQNKVKIWSKNIQPDLNFELDYINELVFQSNSLTVGELIAELKKIPSDSLLVITQENKKSDIKYKNIHKPKLQKNGVYSIGNYSIY